MKEYSPKILLKKLFKNSIYTDNNTLNIEHGSRPTILSVPNTISINLLSVVCTYGIPLFVNNKKKPGVYRVIVVAGNINRYHVKIIFTTFLYKTAGIHVR